MSKTSIHGSVSGKKAVSYFSPETQTEEEECGSIYL